MKSIWIKFGQINRIKIDFIKFNEVKFNSIQFNLVHLTECNLILFKSILVNSILFYSSYIKLLRHHKFLRFCPKHFYFDHFLHYSLSSILLHPLFFLPHPHLFTSFFLLNNFIYLIELCFHVTLYIQ